MATTNLAAYRVEETEVPLDDLREKLKETAEHSGIFWISWVALSTPVLAVLAAIAGLLACPMPKPWVRTGFFNQANGFRNVA